MRISSAYYNELRARVTALNRKGSPMATVLEFLTIITMALEVHTAIATTNADKYAKLTPEQRVEYSYYIAEASHKNGLDPLLVTAVMWHESGFRNLSVNKTNDRGLMQVHWQRLNPKRGEDWLVGLTRKDLMDPRINIHAGARELAHYKQFCKRRKYQKGHKHHWWVHYLSGPDKLGPTPYGRRVNWRYRKLSRTRSSPNT
jgi:soluble lytic murein transglycosylase-like protein